MTKESDNELIEKILDLLKDAPHLEHKLTQRLLEKYGNTEEYIHLVICEINFCKHAIAERYKSDFKTCDKCKKNACYYCYQKCHKCRKNLCSNCDSSVPEWIEIVTSIEFTCLECRKK